MQPTISEEEAGCELADKQPSHAPPGFWIQTLQADATMGIVILLNSVWLAVETDMRSASNDDHPVWFILDSIFNAIFLVEMCMRIYADKQDWCKDVWNVFDAFLVLLGVLGTWVVHFLSGGVDLGFTNIFRLLRTLRLLCLLRVFRLCKELMLIVSGLVSAVRAMIYGVCLLSITIFMFSLLLTRLFGKTGVIIGDAFQDPFYQDYFGSVPRTAFTLLQFTMEFQPDLCRQSWNDGLVLTFLLVFYTCLTNFSILNIISSIMVDTTLSISSSMKSEELASRALENERKEKARLKAAFVNADEDDNGFLDAAEFSKSDSSLLAAMHSAGVHASEAQELFVVLDHRKSGKVSLDAFTDGLVRVRTPPQAKHLLKLECRLEAMNIKIENRIAEVLSLLKETLAPTDVWKDDQHPFAKTSQVLAGNYGTQDLAEILQSEQQALCHDLIYGTSPRDGHLLLNKRAANGRLVRCKVSL